MTGVSNWVEGRSVEGGSVALAGRASKRRRLVIRPHTINALKAMFQVNLEKKELARKCQQLEQSLNLKNIENMALTKQLEAHNKIFRGFAYHILK
jgi:hypothetical protein